MVTDPTISTILTRMNHSVRLILQERDRLNSLYDDSLPNNITVWGLLPQSVQDEIKTQLATNLLAASTEIAQLVSDYSSMNPQP